MSKKFCMLLALLLAAAPTYAQDTIQLLVGSLTPLEKGESAEHAEEVSDVKSKQEWFAIIGDQGHIIARKVTMLVKPARDYCIDGETGKITGKQLTTAPLYSNDIFYLRGMNFTDGQKIVEAAIKEKKSAGTPVAMAPDSTLHLPDMKLMVKGDLTTEHDAQIIRDYHVDVRIKGNTTPLFALKTVEDTVPTLIWAGDVNGDGFPDLLIDTTYHENVSRPTLFLSTATDDGVTYHKAAAREYTGC